MKSIHGGDIYTAKEWLHSDQLLDFSANINPFGVPDCVQSAICAAIPQLSHYPDPNQTMLTNALAAYHHVQSQQIICGNGGADVLFRTVQAIHPKHVVIPVPTFSEYGKALEENGCSVTYWKMPEPFVLTESFLTELQTGKYDFLVLCNPNNPTGSLLSTSLLQKILTLTVQKKIFVLLDECFCDMTETAFQASMIATCNDYPNLFILKSMTKRYAIPGLRLGYGICANTALAEQIRQTGQPWSVNTLASVAGCAALQDIAYQQQFQQFLQTERWFLYHALQELGFTVWEPAANFVFFHAKQFYDLENELLPYHILLRNCGNYRGLDDTYYRVAVRKREENIFLLQCLKEIVQKKSGGNLCEQNLSW